MFFSFFQLNSCTFYRISAKQAVVLVFPCPAVYNNIIRQSFSAHNYIYKRTDGAAERPSAGSAVKRETGANPVRSRHCKRGAFRYFYVTDAAHREGGGVRRSASQETCRLCWYGKLFPGHESLTVLMPRFLHDYSPFLRANAGGLCVFCTPLWFSPVRLPEGTRKKEETHT